MALLQARTDRIFLQGEQVNFKAIRLRGFSSVPLNALL
jgi:hypothetical protein